MINKDEVETCKKEIKIEDHILNPIMSLCWPTQIILLVLRVFGVLDNVPLVMIFIPMFVLLGIILISFLLTIGLVVQYDLPTVQCAVEEIKKEKRDKINQMRKELEEASKMIEEEDEDKKENE